MKKQIKPAKIKCPYCGNLAKLEPATYVYGNKAIEEYVYVCKNYPKCNAYVGVYRDTLTPKGSLANGDLRHKRICAHKAFQKIWENNIMTKKQAYKWMQDLFATNSKLAHIGQFNENSCDYLIHCCQDVLKHNRIAV